MDNLDLNLLVALDALLEDNSVTAAAARLRTSPPAMSRTLARLRRALGDPLLVRAGRDLVPTPRARALRAEVHGLVAQARALFAPSGADDPAHAERVLDLTTPDVLVDVLAPALVTAARAEAPGITLRFRPESLEDTPALRDGTLDLEVGVIARPEPEIRVEPLAELTLVGLVRPGHPLLDGPVTPARFAAADHVVVSRRGRTRGPIDDRLAERGLSRRVVAVVPGFGASVRLARETDVVCLGIGGTADGLEPVEIPLPLDPVRLGMAWHPRHEADRVHRWLRAQVRARLTAGS